MIGFDLLASSAPLHAARFELRVLPDSPYFAGHFPGEPILPAIAQLALAESLAAQVLAAPSAICSIERIRFRAPILPGEHLSVGLALTGAPVSERELHREPEHAPSSAPLRLDIRRGAEAITTGLLHFAALDPARPPAASAAAAPEPAHPPRGSLRPPADLSAPSADPLPHAFPARYIERVLDCDERSSLCLARVPPASPFARAGQDFPAHVSVEMGAQAAAAAESRARGHPSAPARAGFLVTARDAHFHAPRLPLDATYQVRATLARALPPLRSWSIAVLLDGTPLATCELSTFAR